MTEEDPLKAQGRQQRSQCHRAGPTLEELELLSLQDSTDSAQEFRDRTTGLPLNPEMVKRARVLEMQYMDELKVPEDSDRWDTCIAETGRALVCRRRWAEDCPSQGPGGAASSTRSSGTKPCFSIDGSPGR